MNSFIVEILRRSSVESFTVTELRDEFIKLSPKKNIEECRKYIYKQILRMLKCNILVKDGSRYSHNAIYRKTNLFHNIIFIVDEPCKKFLVRPKTNKPTINNLEERLKIYNIEMMSSVGESEEYRRLIDSFPTMEREIREKYIIARDRSSKLMGQMNAIKTILSIQLNKL